MNEDYKVEEQIRIWEFDPLTEKELLESVRYICGTDAQSTVREIEKMYGGQE